MKALLVIDVQNDFCPGGSLAVKDGDQVIPVVNRARRRFDLVVFTKDWHPANHLSFASNHPGKKPGEIVMVDDLKQILWPDHCVQETKGAEFHRELDVRDGDPVFLKGTDPRIDSYSAFFDNAHRRSTGLADFLREKKAKQLTIAGLATDYCVKFSVIDALDEGFSVTVIEDGCRGVNLAKDDSNNAIHEMWTKGAKIVADLS